MVKGVAKRIIVVDSPDPQLFEQAIFILRVSATEEGGITAQQVLEEACKVANGYVRKNVGKRWNGKRSLPPPVFAVLGAAVTAAVWLLVTLL